jgi:hypothetical protein
MTSGSILSGGGESCGACFHKLHGDFGHVESEFVGKDFQPRFSAALAGETVELSIVFKGDDGEPSQWFRRIGGLAHVWVAGSAEWANEHRMSRDFLIKNAT